MSKDRDQPRAPSPWSNHQQQLQQQQQQPPTHYHTGSTELEYARNPARNVQSSALVTTNGRSIDRPNPPPRSSTLGASDPDRNLSANNLLPQSRSEDLNHHSNYNSSFPSNSSPRPSPPFLSNPSRPTTPGSSAHPSSSGHSDNSNQVSNPTSVSNEPSTSNHNGTKPSPTLSTSHSSALSTTSCSACGKAMQGPFVRALGAVYHLNCFKCMDCGDVVASKFFPIDVPGGKQSPLCERDYFRRLNLICAKCGMALRGSYITACNKKFHVEHFTCSLCSTLFGPQDSYYEHDGDVYCHFHYSTRFATKCAGCNSAILKQFVEINRNMRDECWHPECYMINKFWNVKVNTRRPTSTISGEGDPGEPPYVEEEARENPTTLKEKQVRMEQQVYRIWTVLSAFEESSAACISDMLRQVSNGAYLDAIRMAEKFILHVEVLFGTIDDLEYHFASLNMKGMSHVREARMLCRKTVELFTLLSHTQETGERRMGMTQELLALVTGLAHYLKILIRIALTGALRLEREQSIREAMSSFLDKLHLLAVQGGNPAARRMIKGSNGEALTINPNANYGTQGVTYGFRSLAPENAGESPFSGVGQASANPPSDLCVRCNVTVEEDCVRLGTYQRWHSHCVQCAVCGKLAAVPVLKEQSSKSGDEKDNKDLQPQKLSTARRPPANVGAFVYDPDSRKDIPPFGEVPTTILCTDHGHHGCRGGFQAVQRLEQYAFLLNVALRRLYLLLRKQGVVPASPAPPPADVTAAVETSPYTSADIMRMTSVHLDRKLSATARLPKRSTIVESPTGRIAQPSDGTQRQYEPGPQTSTPQNHAYNGQLIQQGQSGQTSYQNYPQSPQPGYQGSPPSQSKTPRLNQQKPLLDTQNQTLKTSLTRSNTEVMIVDDSMPNSPAGAEESPITRRDDALTLADIPQLMEVAQAREQQRSLPRESSTPYIAELSALELAIVRHSAVLSLMRSPLRDQFELDDLLELLETKKSGFWNKIFKGDKKNLKKKGVFRVPLELLVERAGSDSLLGATRATLRVPSFMDDVVSAMRQMDMSIEGIFRKNGNIRRMNDLVDAIDRDASAVDLTQENPVQLAVVLKKFLRDLPDPLMTSKLYKLLIATQALPSDEERLRLLRLLMIIMPKSHRDTTEVLFVFLKWVASFAHLDSETGSKMDLGNLSTVIAPNILRAPDNNAGETFKAVHVVTTLLENQDEIFTVPDEFLAILHDQNYFTNAMDLPSKEFLKKCDTYMRLKGGSRPLVTTPHIGPPNGAPRYPPLNSPASEHPPPGTPFSGPSNMDRRGPPSLGHHDMYSAAPSPSINQGSIQTPPQRPPLPQPPQQQQHQQQVQQYQQHPYHQQQHFQQHYQQQQQQQQEDWNPVPPPRPSNPGSNPTSRPSSFVGTPPGTRSGPTSTML
ncbi:hypothetical protein BJ165DRAFT_1438295 [Panaeolus papilionaceus]|nr:hypothetical protein BJ165DRAFT_1438295 [Panaeolus papilionaceus]